MSNATASTQDQAVDLADFLDHQLRILVYDAYRAHPGLVSRKEEDFILDQSRKPHYWRLSTRQRAWMYSIAVEKLRTFVPEELRP